MSLDTSIIEYLVVGALTGLISGLLGLGGGILMVPIIQHALLRKGLPPLESYKMTLSTSSAIIFISSSMGALAQTKLKNIDRQSIKLNCPLVFLGALIGAQLTQVIPVFILKITFILACLSVLTHSLLNKKDPVPQKPSNHTTINHFFSVVYFLSASLSALISIGGGTIYAPLLQMQGLETKRSIGTSSLLVWTTALGTICGYALIYLFRKNHHSSIDWDIFFFMGIAAVWGAKKGAALLQKMNQKHIKTLFTIVILASTTKMILGLV